MRVISGLYKGRTLTTVKDLAVRPATDRVKQTIFDVLANRMVMDGISVLDLFAGSGGLGIEALSRGAEHATFVENNVAAAAYIEKNLQTLGCDERATVLDMDAESFVMRCEESFDLIFADPPYGYGETAELPRLIFERRLIHPEGYLLIEHTTELSFASTARYLAGPVKRFGRTLVTFFHYPSTD